MKIKQVNAIDIDMTSDELNALHTTLQILEDISAKLPKDASDLTNAEIGSVITSSEITRAIYTLLALEKDSPWIIE